MIVLVDTSVWIAHWRHGTPRLAQLLEEQRVVLHPYVLGELALGAVSSRATVLQHLQTIDAPHVAEQHEVLALAERLPLWGRGIGWVDAHLLASALLDHLRLWTLDRRLSNLADEMNVGLPE